MHLARALQEVGSFAEADRSYVFQVSADGLFIGNTYEWCAQGIAPQIDRLQDIPFDDAMLFCRTIKRFAIVDYPSVGQLPAEAAVDRELLAAQSIQSVLAVPMVANDRLLGFIGLDSVRRERVWLDEEKTLMTLVGNAFTGVLERKRADDGLRASEARYRSVVESVKEVIFQLDEAGRWVFLNRSWADLTGYAVEDTLGRDCIDYVHADDRERHIEVDMAGFERAMEEQRSRARAASAFKVAGNVSYDGADTSFHGYSNHSVDAKVIALYKGTEPVQTLAAGDEGIVVLDNTAFYAEGGGQVGDVGEISAGGGVGALFDVNDTQKIKSAVFGHTGRLAKGSLNIGDTVQATIDLHKRLATARNHSATHLLHAALRKVLGSHVAQKGSLVNAERTRFDFAHGQPLSAEEIAEIERVVNHVVAANHEVKASLMGYDDAIRAGAMALFGEKYGDNVRVLSMGGDFSVELCGGIHANRTGDIGLLKIISEGGVASGVRRIEAVTGAAALAYLNAAEEQLKEAASLVKGSRDNLIDKLSAVLERNRLLEKQLEQLQAKAASAAGDDLSASALDVKGVKVLSVRLDGQDGKALLALVDQLKNKLGRAVILLGSVHEEKVVLVAGVTKDLTGQLKAGDLMKQAAAAVGGKGGGRPDMAQGGGVDAGALDGALALTVPFVEQGL